MKSFNKRQGNREQGFTLLELLIVIGIIAILSVILIIVINPAETLRKARDAQRISDLNTIKTALGIYTTSTATPYLGGASTNATCKTGSGGGTYGAGSKIFYSEPTAVGTITATALDGGSASVPAPVQPTSASSSAAVDGTGWIPVNFASITGGSPISNLPADPIDNVITTTGTLAQPDNTSLVYRYACNAASLTYEIDATLESTEYTSGANIKITTDGGNNDRVYEVGTNLAILGNNNSF